MARTEKAKPFTGSGPLRILFVEDSVADVELALLFLKNAGFETVAEVVSTEEEFSAKLASQRYDVVLSDFRLGNWTGKRALEIVKEQNKGVPFILVTGTLGDETTVEIIKMGAADYVLKDRLSRLPLAVLHALDDNRLREERARAEEEIRELYAALEQRVRGRTAELEAANTRLREETTERLRIAEERDRFFSLALDMLCIAGFDGYFKRLNPAWQKTLGFTTEELLAKPYLEFVHPEDRESTLAEAQKLAAGAETVAFENRYLCQDGSFRWVLWNAAPFGEKQLIYAAARDITERKKAEDAILRAKEEAERVSRFKDQFLSTMSHELRTPLNAIMGFSELLKDERYGSLNDRQRRYLNHISTGGRHLLTLINDILDLSKIEAGRLELAIEEVSVEQAFTEVLNTLRPLAEEKSQTLTAQADSGLFVRADLTRLMQVLINLAGNAIKFTPDRGRIELRAEPHARQIRLGVRDTGRGIAPKDQKRVFEPFSRVRESGDATEGTGLGLAIAQRLLDLHGGRLELESQPGQGCFFWFHLPAGEPRCKPTGEGVGAEPREQEAVRILVVEDDPVAAKLILTQIAGEGYTVFTCVDSSRAVAMAADLQPRAITLDIFMHGVNGWEVLSQLKNDPRTGHIPVIVLSIVDQPAVGLTLGADEYLVKPVGRPALLAALRRLMRFRGDRTPLRPLLVVEDDPASAEVLSELLRAEGFKFEIAADGAAGRAKVAASLPELVILDLLLPQVSGFELLTEWRADPRTADLPVLVLTGKDLNEAEYKYLRDNAEFLLHKQQPWQEALKEHLNRVTRNVTQAVPR